MTCTKQSGSSRRSMIRLSPACTSPRFGPCLGGPEPGLVSSRSGRRRRPPPIGRSASPTSPYWLISPCCSGRWRRTRWCAGCWPGLGKASPTRSRRRGQRLVGPLGAAAEVTGAAVPPARTTRARDPHRRRVLDRPASTASPRNCAPRGLGLTAGRRRHFRRPASLALRGSRVGDHRSGHSGMHELRQFVPVALRDAERVLPSVSVQEQVGGVAE